MTEEIFRKKVRKLDKRIKSEFPDHCPTAVISGWPPEYLPKILRRYADLLEAAAIS